MNNLTQTQSSETNTENIFREFYGVKTFVEKSAISKDYGFTSKKALDLKAIQIFLEKKKII